MGKCCQLNLVSPVLNLIDELAPCTNGHPKKKKKIRRKKTNTLYLHKSRLGYASLVVLANDDVIIGSLWIPSMQALNASESNSSSIIVSHMMPLIF